MKNATNFDSVICGVHSTRIWYLMQLIGHRVTIINFKPMEIKCHLPVKWNGEFYKPHLNQKKKK